MKDFGKLVVSLLLPFIAGGIGSYFTFSEITSWYSTLEKPFFTPPNWVFGPVWTLLYILMGMAFYLVWQTKKGKKVLAYKYYFSQLLLNTLWSIVFFGLHQPVWAFVLILFLWFAIFQTITQFLRIHKLAGQLLYPYIAWVSFASLLNLGIVVLN